jgi:mono/diheme cytochrome c family protein
MNKLASRIVLIIAATTLSAGGAYADRQPDNKQISRGQYLISTSGCNDCHTPGYPQAGGKVPMSKWLMGSPVGFSGPWGTTYPANLRLVMQSMTEKQWLQKAREPRRPPMPWFSLRDMSDDDLRAIYAFVKSLGATGKPAPAFVPPGQKVSTPYIDFVPRNLPTKHAKK